MHARRFSECVSSSPARPRNGAAAGQMSSITEQATHSVKRQQNEIDQVATAMNEMTATVQR